MPAYTVSPIPNSKMWKVESNGTVVSKHRKKKRAVKRARDLKRNNGGTVTVQRKDGQFGQRL